MKRIIKESAENDELAKRFGFEEGELWGKDCYYLTMDFSDFVGWLTDWDNYEISLALSCRTGKEENGYSVDEEVADYIDEAIVGGLVDIPDTLSGVSDKKIAKAVAEIYSDTIQSDITSDIASVISGWFDYTVAGDEHKGWECLDDYSPTEIAFYIPKADLTAFLVKVLGNDFEASNNNASTLKDALLDSFKSEYSDREFTTVLLDWHLNNVLTDLRSGRFDWSEAQKAVKHINESKTNYRRNIKMTEKRNIGERLAADGGMEPSERVRHKYCVWHSKNYNSFDAPCERCFDSFFDCTSFIFDKDVSRRIKPGESYFITSSADVNKEKVGVNCDGVYFDTNSLTLTEKKALIKYIYNVFGCVDSGLQKSIEDETDREYTVDDISASTFESFRRPSRRISESRNIARRRALRESNNSYYTEKTANGYDIEQLYIVWSTKTEGRVYAIITKPYSGNETECVIGMGYDIESGDWQQGKYGFRDFADARRWLCDEYSRDYRIEPVTGEELIDLLNGGKLSRRGFVSTETYNEHYRRHYTRKPVVESRRPISRPQSRYARARHN